jgi:hypothetical protein
VTGDAGARTLTAREIIVATGSAARSVPGIEIDRKTIITSDQAIGLTECRSRSRSWAAARSASSSRRSSIASAVEVT